MSNDSVALRDDEFSFRGDRASVDASAGSWKIALRWHKSGDYQTFNLRSPEHRVVHDAPATVTGTISDGVVQATGDAVVMADLARMTQRG